MLSTLMESRAVRQSRTGTALTSLALHGALIATLVALGSTHPLDGAPAPAQRAPVYVAAPPQPAQVTHTAITHSAPTSAPVSHIEVNIVVPTIVPTSIPSIDASVHETSLEPQIGGGLHPANPIGSARDPGTGGVVDQNLVERIPALLGGAPAPRYPSALREANVTGQVLLRFVIDTLGRAEMGDVTVVESSHAQFSEAVRNVLPQYRFIPGEVGGRKVRTMVQMPFTFKLN